MIMSNTMFNPTTYPQIYFIYPPLTRHTKYPLLKGDKRTKNKQTQLFNESKIALFGQSINSSIQTGVFKSQSTCIYLYALNCSATTISLATCYMLLKFCRSNFTSNFTAQILPLN